MGKINAPRRGSMQFSPRSRAARIYPSISTWPSHLFKETKVLGFAGYKAGMTHMFVLDQNKNTATANQEVFTPVTVLECPPIVPFAVRIYEKTYFGMKAKHDLFSENISKDLSRKLKIKTASLSKIFPQIKNGDVTIVAHTQPREISLKKTPEIMELGISGSTFEEKLNFAKQLLGRTIKVSDIFREGELIDVTAVTKGKGTQGPVKRFGIRTFPRKHSRSGKERHVGTLGDRHAAVRFTVPQAGQTGYNTRTDFNKIILRIGNNGTEITPKGGFLGYGNVQGDYIAVKGSVPGSTKRLVRIRPAIKMHRLQITPPKVTYVSLESKQGH